MVNNGPLEVLQDIQGVESQALFNKTILAFGLFSIDEPERSL